MSGERTGRAGLPGHGGLPGYGPDPSDGDVEEGLTEVVRSFAFPPTPDLAASVRARLESERLARPRRITADARPSIGGWLGRLLGGGRRPARRGALAATVGVLILAGGVVAAALGVAGVRILFVDQLPTPTPPATAGSPTPGTSAGRTSGASPSAAPTDTTPGAHLDLGRPVGLRDAMAGVSYGVLVPGLPEFAAPDAVYLREPPVGGHVALVYRPRAGLPASPQTGVALLITQFQGRLHPGYATKLVLESAKLEYVTVDGARGIWIEGPPHGLVYDDRHGREVTDRFRLATNTLLWEQGDLTLRIEGDITRDEALRIAASMRAAPAPPS